MPQTLAVFQSLWAMEDLPWPGTAPWTLAERIDRIAGAGYAGVAIDLGAAQAPAASDLAPLLEQSGLRCHVLAFVSESKPVGAALDYAKAVGGEALVVCGQVFPATEAEAARVVGAWLAAADQAGVRMQLETHRYTLTNDLGFTVRLLDELPEVELSADLSHYVAGNELPDPGPGDARAEGLITRILDRSGSFQGRIATRGQVQVSPSFPQHAAAARRFRNWWRQGFASWRRRFPDDAECVFYTELGTTPYAITGPDGVELTDRWAEALQLKSWAEELFAEELFEEAQ